MYNIPPAPIKGIKAVQLVITITSDNGTYTWYMKGSPLFEEVELGTPSVPFEVPQ